MRNSITQSQDCVEHVGILAIAYVRNLESWATLCCAFVTAKLGTMKRVEALKIVYRKS